MKIFLAFCKQFFSNLSAALGRTARLVRGAARTRAVCVSVAAIAALGVYSTNFSELGFSGDFSGATLREISGDAMLEAGVHISRNDYVSGGVSPTPIDAYGVVDVTVVMDGVEQRFSILEGVVSAALHRAGYTARPMDLIEPLPKEPMTDGMVITVIRREVRTETLTEVLPFEKITEDNPSINYGTNVVTQEGADGSRVRSYEIIMHDGVEISRELVSDELTPPVTQITQHGCGGTVKMKDGTVLKFKQRLEVSATAYTTERQTGKINALGNIARVGTIAVDPKVIKMRSRVYVVAANDSWEYGLALCEDTGGSIKGLKIDLFFDTWDECVQFGRRKAIVYVLE